MTVAAAASLSGCAAPSDLTPTTTSTWSFRTSEPQNTGQPPTPKPAAIKTAAEDAAQAALPNAPAWRGMTFQGHIISDSQVCVDRWWRNGDNAGYQLIDVPSYTLTGTPKDGTCANRQPPKPPPPPVSIPANVQGEPGLMSRNDLGRRWPLTVPYVVVDCQGSSVTLTAPDGKRYAVNGTAQSQTELPDIDPIWADAGYGTKKNIGPVIDHGLAMC